MYIAHIKWMANTEDTRNLMRNMPSGSMSKEMIKLGRVLCGRPFTDGFENRPLKSAEQYEWLHEQWGKDHSHWFLMIQNVYMDHSIFEVFYQGVLAIDTLENAMLFKTTFGEHHFKHVNYPTHVELGNEFRRRMDLL